MKKIFAIATLGVLAVVSAQAQTTQRLTANKASEYALIYSLPRTAVDITIEAELTESAPGEFYNYANRHLGITDAIRAPRRTAAIKSVTVGTHGEPDADSRWQVQFKSGTSPYIMLDEGGVPIAVNTDVAAAVEKPVLPVAKAAAPSPLETEAARQAVTQDMTRSSSVSKRAELAAQRVFELREMRSDLLSGQSDNTPPDGRSMQLMLDNIAAQEAALTAMFAGTTKTSTVVSTVTIVPDSVDTERMVLARISPVDGIVGADNLSGAPVYLNIRTNSRATLPLTDKGEPKRFPKGGFAYNIPGEATVEIVYDGEIVASVPVQLSQLGVTFGIDPDVFTDKKAPSMLQLDQATGAIRLLAPVNRP
ncbi:MAG: DUF4831 family protein [Muribaculaceae bacterium]|nr:DUF4831 family protein [Muribaculaceae bacterium]